MKNFSKDFKSIHTHLEIESKTAVSLHYFDGMLCFAVLHDTKWGLFQYDLISGEVSIIVLNENERYVCVPVICSKENKLFVISETVNEKDEVLLVLSVFQRDSITASLKLCNQKSEFHLFNYDSFFERFFAEMYFSHCYADKLYVFYRKHSNVENMFEFEDIYFLTVCNQTLLVLKDQKLSTANITLDQDLLDGNTKFTSLTKICQKQDKLFILMKTVTTVRSKRVYRRKILIFDMKNDLFYCAGTLHNWVPSYGALKHLDYTIGKDGTVYGFYRFSKKKHQYSNLLQQKFFCFATTIKKLDRN